MSTPAYTIVITKFDKLLDSGSVCVGFNVVLTETAGSLFIDKVIPIPSSESGVSDKELVDTAWNLLLPSIQTWITDTTRNKSIIGTFYTPNTPTDT
jgi:hypothetical protein